MAMGIEKTCGFCQYWHKRPVDPTNLGAPTQGDCRGGPPQLVALPMQGGAQIQALYPILPERFPACGQHKFTNSELT